MNKILLKDLRLETHKLMLRIIRTMTAISITPDYYEGTATDAILCSAVFVGQAEGKPFNATKLSHYTGIPRPTVIRRLKELEREGFVNKSSRLCYSLPDEIINHPEVVGRWSVLFNDIQVFIEAVSKMDGPEVAPKKESLKKGTRTNK